MMWKNIAGDYFRAFTMSGIKELLRTNAGVNQPMMIEKRLGEIIDEVNQAGRKNSA